MQKSNHKQLWQQALAECMTNPQELFSILELPYPENFFTPRQFPLRVPRSFVARMKKRDLQDPLLRQILPILEEQNSVPGFSLDPLGEKHVSPIPGLLHKYPNRVLMILTGACAIHCRYCFRRHFPYSQHKTNLQNWDSILRYIQQDARITEVILSGGEPLILPDETLETLVLKIAQIPHVKRLRVHTRLVVTLPERVTPMLVSGLSQTRLIPILVTHINHPNELDDSLKKGFFTLKKAGITLLNQTVLLKDINDTASCLVTLSQRLFDYQILPYYLHVMDKVSGAAHFEVSEEKAKYLLKTILEQLPGYLVPKLVREEAGGHSKTILNVA